MAYDDLRFPGGKKLEPFAKDHSSHLVFVILVLSAIVPSGSRKTSNADTLFCDDTCMYVRAANRGRIPVSNIMISFYVKKRGFVKSSEVGEVFRR